jgi:hypothetical protein
MSKGHILGISVLVTLAAVVLIATVAVVKFIEFGENLNRYFDEGLLGPEDQRQRIELPTHGFAVSIGDDWTAEIPSPDPQVDERLGMRALLTIDPREEGAACFTYVAAGAAPPGHSADGRRSDSEVLSDSAARLLRPWFEEQGLLGDGWGGTIGDSWGDKAGFHFGVEAGSTGAVWVVPHAADLYVLTCTWTAGPDGESRPEFWGDPHLMMLALEPMAESFEFLPRASPAPTPRPLGRGGRVQARTGLALTFPDGWTIIESTVDDDEHAEALIPDRVLPWRSSPIVTGIRLTSGGPGAPVESCTLDDLMLAGYMGSWDDAPLESIVALLFPLEIQPEAFALTYIDLPADRVARVDFYDGQSTVSTYVLPHHKTLHRLVCVGRQGRTRAWDGIVESIELSPPEG